MPETLWTASTVPQTVTENDTASVELGVRFRSNVAGTITGIRFYKGPQNTGTHTGSVWTSTGTRLGTVTFTSETTSGWQTATFATPISISANTNYVASYLAPNGGYSVNENYFTTAYSNGGALTAPASTGSARNGVYRYGATGGFPTSPFRASNYWVDVVFQPGTPPANTAPVANDDSVSTQQGTALRIPFATLLSNDTDADGDTLTVASVTSGTGGTATVSAATSEVVFTPAAGFTGPASFSYTASDGRGGTDPANVAVTVTAPPPGNTAPVANDDSVSTQQGTALRIPFATLLANDTDADGDTLSVASVTSGTGGTATLSAATNEVVFTPTAGFTGPGSFSYSASDGRGGTDPANVAVTVTAPPPAGTNAIVIENQKPGNPKSEWDLSGAPSTNIQGFATDMSVDRGSTVNFKINTNSTNYRIDIYRLGYYGGLGARKLATIQRTLAQAQNQPAPLTNGTTGLVDADNWNVSASWAVPGDAVSGVYLAKLVRQDGTPGQNHIPFIVRNDGGTSDIILQTSDTTWQAYNTWGGNSLYTGSPAGRAYKVSYNRPFTNRGDTTGTTGPRDFLFDSDYPMLRWLEANGYDVSYISGIDTDRAGGQLLNHDLFVSVGHDEYWSGGQRANVETARSAGVNLAFFSGNEVFWKTRWEGDADGTPHRTLVSYKETHANAKIDPSPQWTGTWRDPRFSPPSDGGRPENALTGTIFTVNDGSLDRMTVNAEDGMMRLWRNTDLATLAAGQQRTLTANVLTYEWDEDLDNSSRPAGTFRMSTTNDPNTQYLLDYGSTYGNRPATHSLTTYRAPSGALVFGAGTARWAWGLDPTHDTDRGGSNATATDTRIAQATVNLFADMGLQPASLQGGLTPATRSTDATAPASAVTGPSNGASVPLGPLTITGTAADAGGGRVGGVEVSTDGGTTWRRAVGRGAWTYQWTPAAAGTHTIRSRAVDDSGNLESPGGGVSVTVTGGPPPVDGNTIFSASAQPQTLTDPDTGAVELGVKFRANFAGTITGIRFYKGPQNTGTHTGRLWSATGTNLGTVNFIGETASGWQTANFAQPIPIQANTTYVASYHAPNGRYSVDEGYFATETVSGPLRALASAASGGNGVYAYGPAGSFPTGTFNQSNYWVDVVFRPTLAA